MPKFEVNFALYRKAIAADDAYSRELVRVYGKKRASDMRYKNSPHEDRKLQAARLKKRRADDKWLQEMRRGRQ